jgi:hypothetical protein
MNEYEIEFFAQATMGEDGGPMPPRQSPYSVYRVLTSRMGGGQRVDFWDPNDQTWNHSVLPDRDMLLGDMLASGGWVRQLLDDEEFPQVVPNYEKGAFGA